MGRRVAFTENVLDFVGIGERYEVFVKSINLYHSHVNPAFGSFFEFYTKEKLEMESRLQ